jgi:predicted lipoprotein with Yx(FWY)xxD motif
MNHIVKSLVPVILGSFLWACTGVDRSDLSPMAIGSSAVGTVLVNGSGMTLYTYKDDVAGKSACNGRCSRKWPPVEAASGAVSHGRLTIIERRDGKRQYAYDGKALYTWIKDKAPGDATGHKLGEAWYVVRP